MKYDLSVPSCLIPAASTLRTLARLSASQWACTRIRPCANAYAAASRSDRAANRRPRNSAATQHAASARRASHRMFFSARRPARRSVAASTIAHSHASPVAAFAATHSDAAPCEGSGTLFRARMLGSSQMVARVAASSAANGRRRTTPSNSTGRSGPTTVITQQRTDQADYRRNPERTPHERGGWWVPVARFLRWTRPCAL